MRRSRQFLCPLWAPTSFLRRSRQFLCSFLLKLDKSMGFALVFIGFLYTGFRGGPAPAAGGTNIPAPAEDLHNENPSLVALGKIVPPPRIRASKKQRFAKTIFLIVLLEKIQLADQTDPLRFVEI